MTAQGFDVFDTALGPCGIAWGGRGIVGVQLPESSEAATRARLRRRFPDAPEVAPPVRVRRAQQGIVALLAGKRSDLSGVALDLDGLPAFQRRVYEAAREIPSGTTLSYGELAARLGAPGAARAVGQALGKNPFAIVVPCHRVLAAGQKSGGFTAEGGVATKLRMLAIEGVTPAKKEPAANGALGFDPRAALRHLRASDPALARVIDTLGAFSLELKKTQSLFGALSEAIVYQQLSGKAAATIYGRVCALCPRKLPTAEHILAASDTALRAAGLSRSKLLSLRDLAERTRSGELPSLAALRRMPDDQIVERLVPVRGIGRWTVEMLLIFRLGRPDVLPVDDYGVRKGFQVAFRKRALPTRVELEKRGARWAPYRTVASWYLWRAADAARQAEKTRR
ncbi:MAG TPA: methylated-DNA--[protein]-cysteine S-methyltransferase [Myxococcota bacterium]|jgi:O-6-methylguanine DNA methyltransferase|nr:methylated-DNA--[protein]-cysteine S-methyltransferase [Myxococcota bacterium]